MDDPRAEYRRRLTARIEALEAACRTLASLPTEAIPAIRRLAHGLRGSGATFGFLEITEAARATEEAPDEQVAAATERLLSVLREVVEGSEGPRHVVLIVDDDPAIGAILERVVLSAGCRPWVVGTLESAEDYLTLNAVSLVILDLLMPDGDGRSLLARLRRSSRTASLPVFIHSVKVSNEVKTECFALGADVYFEKPADPAVLRAAITSRIRRTSGPVVAPPPAPEAPVVESGAGPPAGADEGRATGGGARSPARQPILLAEDDDLLRSIVSHRLGREGFDVTKCPDGEAALAAARLGVPVLAILDVRMPGMDGFELLGHLRQLPDWAEVPILILTAADDEQDLARAFALGANDYMVKPFSPGELVARVRRLTAR